MKDSVEFHSELPSFEILFFFYQRLRKGRKKEHSDQFRWSLDNKENVDWWERCNFLRMGGFFVVVSPNAKTRKIHRVTKKLPNFSNKHLLNGQSLEKKSKDHQKIK